MRLFPRPLPYLVYYGHGPDQPLTELYLDPQLDRVATWVSRGLTAHDASYVALAEQLGFPLVTEDRAILEVARDVAIALGDVPPRR